MSVYETLRHFADSWGLAALFLVFLAAILWVFRPGSRKIYEEQGEIPFRDETPGKTPASRHGTASTGDKGVNRQDETGGGNNA